MTDAERNQMAEDAYDEWIRGVWWQSSGPEADEAHKNGFIRGWLARDALSPLPGPYVAPQPVRHGDFMQADQSSAEERGS